MWRKSSYSGTETECVEVSMTQSVVGVRDTKDRAGGTLSLSASAWTALLENQRRPTE
jgi:hypothetical protein